jgi:hypothetical protein
MELTVQLNALATSPLGKEPPVLIEYEAGWAAEYLDVMEKREIIFPRLESNPNI